MGHAAASRFHPLAHCRVPTAGVVVVSVFISLGGILEACLLDSRSPLGFHSFLLIVEVSCSGFDGGHLKNSFFSILQFTVSVLEYLVRQQTLSP